MLVAITSPNGLGSSWPGTDSFIVIRRPDPSFFGGLQVVINEQSVDVLLTLSVLLHWIPNTITEGGQYHGWLVLHSEQ